MIHWTLQVHAFVLAPVLDGRFKALQEFTDEKAELVKAQIIGMMASLSMPLQPQHTPRRLSHHRKKKNSISTGYSVGLRRGDKYSRERTSKEDLN